MKTAEAGLTAARADLAATNSVEALFPNYTRVLRLVVAEHDATLAGLARWTEGYRVSGLPLDKFLAEREEELLGKLSDHSQQAGAVFEQMPDIIDGLPDLSAHDRSVRDRAAKAQNPEAATSVIRNNASESVVQALISGVDHLTYKRALAEPDLGVSLKDVIRFASGRAAREAMLDGRNAAVYRKLIQSSESAEAATEQLKSQASSAAARSAMRAGYDKRIVEQANAAPSIFEARRILEHGSDNLTKYGKHSNKPKDVSTANPIASEALSGSFQDVLLDEELAAARQAFIKQNRGVEFEDGAFKSPKLTAQWQKLEARIRRKYPEASAQHNARQEQEQAQEQEQQRQARHEWEEQYRQRQYERQQRQQQSHSRTRDYFTPPKREKKTPRPTEFPREQVEATYQTALTALMSRSHADGNTLKGYDQEDVYWVIDRILKARQESEAAGKRVSDRTLFVQFMRLSNNPEHPKPEDVVASQIINTLMNGPSGSIPF